MGLMNCKPLEKIIRPMIEYDVHMRFTIEESLQNALRELKYE